MKTMEMPASQGEFQRAMRQGRREGIVLIERGKPVAAIVPIEDADAETLSLSTNPTFLKILRQSFKQLDAGRALSLAEMRSRVLSKKPRAARNRG
jgi:hypothetical protein